MVVYGRTLCWLVEPYRVEFPFPRLPLEPVQIIVPAVE